MADVLFTPPTHEEGITVGDKWLRHYRITRANSIFWNGTTWASTRSLNDDVIKGLEEGVTYFRGGCTYVIDQALADAIVGAVVGGGGGASSSGSRLGYGRASYGQTPYGE
jgi:hypothetical protein